MFSHSVAVSRELVFLKLVLAFWIALKILFDERGCFFVLFIDFDLVTFLCCERSAVKHRTEHVKQAVNVSYESATRCDEKEFAHLQRMTFLWRI